jgi:hypothetical protein
MQNYYEQVGSKKIDLPDCNKAVNLSQALKELLDKRISKRQDRFGKLLHIWQEILPPGLYKHCRISNVENGILKVKTDSPVYSNELKWASSDLLRELKRKCPKARIRKIKCTIG